MKILFCIAAVLAIREINAAATGAVREDGQYDSTTPLLLPSTNGNCPRLNGTGNATTGDIINGKRGCYKLKCNETGWIGIKTTHCLCCYAFNDPHYTGVGAPEGRQGTGSYDHDLMKKCSWCFFYRHRGSVTEGDLEPNGPSQCSLFAFFHPCQWGTSGTSLTCIRYTTFTYGPKLKRIQLKFELLDSTQSVQINKVIGKGAPESANSNGIPLTLTIVLQSVDLSKVALLFHFKTADLKSCVRCIWNRGMLVVCPNLFIFFYRPDKDLDSKNLFLFGLCGKWDQLNANGHTSFENPDDATFLGQPDSRTQFMEWANYYYADLQPECIVHNVTRKEPGDSGLYIAASEKTCKGYRTHVDVCTKTVNKHGSDLPEATKQTSIRGCVTDMCGVTRGARNDEELQKGLNKWVEVAAEVAEVISMAG